MPRRVRLAEAEAPKHRRVRFLSEVVHLVGNQDDRLLAAAQHFHHGFVGGGRPDGRVHHEEHGVGELHGHLGLLCHAGVDAAGVVLPSAGVYQREVAAVPVGRVHDAVTVTQGVLHHGFTAAQDAVHQRRLPTFSGR